MFFYFTSPIPFSYLNFIIKKIFFSIFHHKNKQHDNIKLIKDKKRRDPQVITGNSMRENRQ